MRLSWKPSIIVTFLLVVLTWLLVNTQTFDLERHYRTNEELRALKNIDVAINIDILEARFGLQANYDSLVFHWQQFLSQLDLVKVQLPATSGSIQVYLNVLQKTIVQKDAAIELFKSRYAVLQNSLHYFPIVTSLLANISNPELAATLNQLLQDTLNYNLNASVELLDQIVSSLAQLEQTPGISKNLANVVLHGKTIIQLKTEVENLLKTLLSAPTDEAIDNLSLAYFEYYKQLLKQTNFYQVLLYIVAIALLIYVTILYRTRHNAQQLQVTNALLERKVAEQTQELRQTLQTLQQSQIQLIHAEKMSGLGQLVAGIAHEVNNPINFIDGNLGFASVYTLNLLHLVELYQKHYPEPVTEICNATKSMDFDYLRVDLPSLLSSMEVGTSRILEIVTSLRSFSRKDEVGKKAVDLHVGIESTLLILGHRLKATCNRREISLKKYYGELPLVECHAGHINQVFMNLLANAIDALDAAAIPQPTIIIYSQVVESNSICIRIIDNGTGIPEEIQKRLFDPFFTTKPVGKGTGMGLSISYQIITEQHHGAIACISQPGKGTEFRVTIPTRAV